jgi:hypothetical protein
VSFNFQRRATRDQLHSIPGKKEELAKILTFLGLLPFISEAQALELCTN